MWRLAGWVLACCACLDALAGVPQAVPDLTAGQIVENNVAARGGTDAWRKVETMSWVGHAETAAAPGTPLAFRLEMKRPNKTRFAITAPQRMSMHVFDGQHGWKLRLADGGTPSLQPYSAEETAFALEEPVIDAPLIAYQSRGVPVVLESIDELEGNKAYRLGVKLPSGAVYHVWIDAQSFLEVESERELRGAAGRHGRVTKLYRNYRDIDGLQIPYIVETRLGSGRVVGRMIIETVVLNPPLDDQKFDKPRVPGRASMQTTLRDKVPRVAARQRAVGLPEQGGPTHATLPGPVDVQ